MPVRLRITLLFTLVVFFLLGLVCAGVYYFSYTARINAINTRLTNRAITTARLLSQREIFDQNLIRRIDSSTTIALKNKTVQAYDYRDYKIYTYSDVAGDSLHINKGILDEARVKGKYFFYIGDKEAVAYNYSDSISRMVIISAAEDVDGRQNLYSLQNILLLSFVIGNILVLISGYFFSRGLVNPIKKISEDVAEISAQNLARRIQTGKSRDEWYQLSSMFNELLDRIQESFELQRRFISNASHELSTPLTSISSQLEVSMQRKRGADEYLKVMQSIYQDVKHMSNLTQALLEFAKASGSKAGIEIDLVRIDEILLGLPAELQKTNPAFIVKLNFEELPEEEERLLVFGNEALIFTAIRNLVVNACKYSPDHTSSVQLSVSSTEIVITIKDNGIGIAKEELSNIFQPFYRAGDNKSTGGFGLGLSLAERIIKIHKGMIGLTSEVNKGTTFAVRFPGAKSLNSL